MAITAQNLIDRARQRADFVSSTYLTDSTELLTWCEDSYKELYDLIAEAYGDQYLQVRSDVTVTSGVTALSSVLVHKLIRVDRAINGMKVPLVPFNFADVVIPVDEQDWGTQTIQYALEGDSLWTLPSPTGSETVTLYYVARATLTSLSGTIHATAEPWAEYIVVDLAIKMRVKEESDTADLRMDKEALRRRIVQVGTPRDHARAMRTIDVRYFDEVAEDVWGDIWP